MVVGLGTFLGLGMLETMMSLQAWAWGALFDCVTAYVSRLCLRSTLNGLTTVL